MPREEVIRRYVSYDLRKKGKPQLTDLDGWPWNSAEGLDGQLRRNELEDGVLAAYRTWHYVQLPLSDLLSCAIVNTMFPGESQLLGHLLLQGKLAEWLPRGAPEWWPSLSSGAELTPEAALILRPRVHTERPAKWYIEDGSGRALALVQGALRHAETDRTAWAYVGVAPDKSSPFMKSHDELLHVTGGLK
ncbi:MAG: hypothetical protein AB7O37_00570 [Vicinamibacteria bacterium]